jgi:hypothetical protein
MSDWYDLGLSVLFPSVLWFQLLRLIKTRADIATQYGFEITLSCLTGLIENAARSEKS